MTPGIQRHIPMLYGWQATNLGPGLVFDYYRQPNGQRAPNLEEVILSQGLTAEIKRAIVGLSAFILNNAPWMRHPVPFNIVYAADKNLKLVDCIGTYTMPWRRHLPVIRNQRRRRHLAYMSKSISELQKQYEKSKGSFLEKTL